MTTTFWIFRVYSRMTARGLERSAAALKNAVERKSGDVKLLTEGLARQSFTTEDAVYLLAGVLMAEVAEAAEEMMEEVVVETTAILTRNSYVI